MRLLESLSDETPRIAVAGGIGLVAALLAFGIVCVFTAVRGAGLDFLIVVGLLLSVLVGLTSMFVAMRMIRSRYSA